MTENRNGPTTNYNDTQPYVVGILSPSTTLYIDPMPSGREISPPSDLNVGRRRTASNSFQITSVTVQGSRSKNDGEYDSADDLDDITSHTDDLSSDFLDSSRGGDGYHSEDNSVAIADDLSPCGPIIFAARDPNMNSLSLGVTPTFASIGPSVVAGGVTMMTSKSESPISAQVPIMNPLPDNWQRRFKVVKIMSSEPFQRGRWLCADFKDPPAALQEGEGHPPGTTGSSDGAGTPPPTIQITPCGDVGLQPGEGGLLHQFAQVYEIPINQTFNGNFVVGDHQMYGIILPQNEHLQPVTLVQDMSLQTMGLMDQNFNNLAMNSGGYGFQHAILHQLPQQPASLRHVHHHTLVNNGFGHHPPSSVASANNNNNNQYSSAPQQQAVPAIPNHVLNDNNNSGRNSPDITAAAANRTSTSSTASTSSDDNRVAGGTVIRVPPTTRPEDADGQHSESCSTLASEVLQAPGVPKATSAPNYVNDGLCCSPPVQSRNLPPSLPIKPVIVPPQTVASSNVLPSVTTAATLAEINSSQTAPEKIPPSEVGHEVDPSAGSAASTGGNTVAIDNKIEQAMDLVKSHLMFAVREEVEVLKEKITELLERISQLEHENDILRANASAETLKQLSNQSQKKSTGGGNAGKPQSVATIPPST